MGGHVHQCDHCGRQVYAFHSCRNRHCPKCHRDQTDRWLTAQRARLLPCAYDLLTFTLPDQLRPLARSHRKTDPRGRPRSATDARAMTLAVPDVARSLTRARAVSAAPCAAPTSRTCVRRVPIESGVPPSNAAHLRPPVQTPELLALRLLTTRPRPLKLQ